MVVAQHPAPRRLGVAQLGSTIEIGDAECVQALTQYRVDLVDLRVPVARHDLRQAVERTAVSLHQARHVGKLRGSPQHHQVGTVPGERALQRLQLPQNERIPAHRQHDVVSLPHVATTGEDAQRGITRAAVLRGQVCRRRMRVVEKVQAVPTDPQTAEFEVRQALAVEIQRVEHVVGVAVTHHQHLGRPFRKRRDGLGVAGKFGRVRLLPFEMSRRQFEVRRQIGEAPTPAAVGPTACGRQRQHQRRERTTQAERRWRQSAHPMGTPDGLFDEPVHQHRTADRCATEHPLDNRRQCFERQVTVEHDQWPVQQVQGITNQPDPDHQPVAQQPAREACPSRVDRHCRAATGQQGIEPGEQSLVGEAEHRVSDQAEPEQQQNFVDRVGPQSEPVRPHQHPADRELEHTKRRQIEHRGGLVHIQCIEAEAANAEYRQRRNGRTTRGPGQQQNQQQGPHQIVLLFDAQRPHMQQRLVVCLDVEVAAFGPEIDIRKRKYGVQQGTAETLQQCRRQQHIGRNKAADQRDEQRREQAPRAA